ncbi:hypothetical protein [Capnocytophaga bilenii]
MKHLLYCIFLLVCPILYAQEVKVETNTKNIKIGEQIHYKISVENSNGNVVIFPEGQTFMPLEMVKARDTDTIRNGISYTLIKEYYLTQFDEGKYTIPRQRVRISDKDYYLDSLQIEVHTVAIDTLKQPLYEIKPITNVANPTSSMAWLWWLLAALAIIALLFLSYFFVFRRKKLSPEEKRKKLLPFDRAIQDLKELQNSKYLIESKHKEYYTRLTDIVKEYLEDEVHILAKESTTDELLTKINLLQSEGKLNLSQETILNLKRVLQNADLVKFAKSKPSDNNAEYDRETIENVVIKTKEAIPTEVVEGQPINDNFTLEIIKIAERRKKHNRYAVIGTICFILLIPLFVIAYNQLSDSYLNDYKKLNNQEWVTSDYGYPITELTTPEVLIRKQIVDVAEYKSLIGSQQTFYWGSLNAPLYIMTNIITFKKEAQNTAQQGTQQELTLDPQKVNEIVLSQLDKAGAKNITTLQEEYTSATGTKGIKVYGKMTIPDVKGNSFIASYELYSFTENNALQQLLITYVDNPQAEAIAQRVVGSIVFKTE